MPDRLIAYRTIRTMATSPPFEAIFDFDGVLADSLPLIVELLDRLLRQELGMHLSDAQLRAAVGPPFRESVAALCVATGSTADDPLVDAVVERFRAEYGERVAAETQMFDGVEDALAAIGDVARLSICSSKPRPLIDAILAAWGASDVFADIEAPAFGAGEAKAIGLARLHARSGAVLSRAALIGDTVFDARAAAATATPFVGVGWGVGAADDLRAAGACRIAATPPDLVGIIHELAR